MTILVTFLLYDAMQSAVMPQYVVCPSVRLSLSLRDVRVPNHNYFTAD